jgi:hypothetical protein
MFTIRLRKKSIIIFTLTILISVILIPHSQAQALILTVLTDKYNYNMGDPVTIYGNLTQNNQPISGAFIALQLKTPSYETLLIRTVQTAPNTTVYCPIYIWRVTPCDQNGNPKNSFPRGSLAHFKIELSNYSPDPLTPLVTVNPFDANNISIGYTFTITMPIQPGSGVTQIILQIAIPSDATIGTAQVYANAFTNWPELNGTAYCPEKSATFEITSSGGAGNSQSINANELNLTLQNAENGTYSLSFRLHPTTPIGTYTIFATSQYQSEIVAINEFFLVGVKGDIDHDGTVGPIDLGIMGAAWGSFIGETNYNPDADLDNDGAIGPVDLGILGQYWGYTGG